MSYLELPKSTFSFIHQKAASSAYQVNFASSCFNINGNNVPSG
jgi:hypothetical protein